MKNKIFLGAILSSFCALAFYMTSINRMKTQTLEIYGNSTAKVLLVEKTRLERPLFQKIVIRIWLKPLLKLVQMFKEVIK